MKNEKRQKVGVLDVRPSIAVRKDLDFTVFSRAVAARFQAMSTGTLYRVRLTSPTPFEAGNDATKTILWDAYQAAWPEGTNEVFRERREHDCQACKGFVRAVGAVVAIVDGSLNSIWDVPGLPEPYATVALRMAELARGGAIDGVFLHPERQVGVAKNFQEVVKGVAEAGLRAETSTITWNHFSVVLPPSAVRAKKDIGPALADARAAHDVLLRGLEELTLDAVDAVLELVAQNSLYRGEESRFALTEFRKVKAKWETLRYGMGMQDVLDGKRDCFVWAKSSTLPPSAARIRNTAIGTLLIDLSGTPGRTYEAGECTSTICNQRPFMHTHEGAEPLDLEDAVRKFETSVMAPANYKRPMALVSKAMIEKARKTIDELGLAPALERRYAVPEDVTVANVLYADRSSAKALGGQRGGGKTARSSEDAFAQLSASVPENPRAYDKVEEVGVGKFLKDVLPRAKMLEVMFENRHAANLVSLVAPVDPTAPALFKWPNGFSWSYAGDVADSIKERVKRAGGSVVGDLCCRLAWDYADDLDFHMQEPPKPTRNMHGFTTYSGSGDTHIFYGNVRRLSASGGMLDLDANGCDGMKAEPAENIFYADKGAMAEGVYELSVHNYQRRTSETGFEAQVEFGGVVHSFSYGRALRTGENVTVAKIRYSKAAGFEVVESLPSSRASKTVWGLATQKFQKASMVMLSPNWWTKPEVEAALPSGKTAKFSGDAFAGRLAGVGNKHWFFMLEGCANEGTARPFYNEMLRAGLEPHRKTLEMVGARLRVDESARQLSGLWFSSTKRDSLTVRVTGSLVRVLKVVF